MKNYLNGFESKLTEIINTKEMVLPEYEHMSPQMYVHEFRTISLGLPRRVGKTHYIMTHARAGDIVFSMNQDAVNHAYREYGVVSHSIGGYSGLFDYGRRRICGDVRRMPPQRIWFDEIQPRDTDKVYRVLDELIVSKSQLVIWLGTRVF